jgi:hypothetical protein
MLGLTVCCLISNYATTGREAVRGRLPYQNMKEASEINEKVIASLPVTHVL